MVADDAGLQQGDQKCEAWDLCQLDFFLKRNSSIRNFPDIIKNFSESVETISNFRIFKKSSVFTCLFMDCLSWYDTGISFSTILHLFQQELYECCGLVFLFVVGRIRKASVIQNPNSYCAYSVYSGRWFSVLQHFINLIPQNTSLLIYN